LLLWCDTTGNSFHCQRYCWIGRHCFWQPVVKPNVMTYPCTFFVFICKQSGNPTGSGFQIWSPVRPNVL
jgi:hypothetical protein